MKEGTIKTLGNHVGPDQGARTITELAGFGHLVRFGSRRTAYYAAAARSAVSLP